MENVAIKIVQGEAETTYNTKNGKEKTKDMDYNRSRNRLLVTITRHGGLGHEVHARVMALSIKCDSLALRTESREE